MRIVLFRHGPAGRRDSRRWPDDALRPLSPRGIERTRDAARGLARLVTVTRIVSSPLLRATQSADFLRRAAELGAEVENHAALAPGVSYHRVLERLAEFKSGDTIALVGHEPDLGKLAAVLTFGAPASSLPLKKAGACVIDFVGKPEAGRGRLVAFLPPRVLRMRARSRSRA